MLANNVVVGVFLLLFCFVCLFILCVFFCVFVFLFCFFFGGGGGNCFCFICYCCFVCCLLVYSQNHLFQKVFVKSLSVSYNLDRECKGHHCASRVNVTPVLLSIP